MRKGGEDDECGGGVRRRESSLDEVVKHEGGAGLDAVLDEKHSAAAAPTSRRSVFDETSS